MCTAPATSGRGGGRATTIPQWFAEVLHVTHRIPVRLGTHVRAGMASEDAGRVPIILDCDPGHDDALAILLACGCGLTDLRLVTTVGGNVPVSSTTANAVRFLHACGRPDVPVVQGASRPLVAEAVACHEIHGKSGMDGFAHWPDLASAVPVASALPAGGGPVRRSLPAPESTSSPSAAIAAMADALTAASEHARASGSAMPVLVATGPLTNVALLLRMRPDLVTSGALTRIVIMGGSIGMGNTSPAAEFNIEVDPHAAAIVLGAARPGAFAAEAAMDGTSEAVSLSVTMVPLDVTHTALVTEAVRSRLASVRKDRGEAPLGWSWRARDDADFPCMLDGLMQFFGDTYAKVFGFVDGPPVHDPCAMLAAFCPSAFEMKPCRVLVETTGLCAGRTVVDLLGVTNVAAAAPALAPSAAAAAASGAASFRGNASQWHSAPVVNVATQMDRTTFWDIMMSSVAFCDAQSPLSLTQV